MDFCSPNLLNEATGAWSSAHGPSRDGTALGSLLSAVAAAHSPKGVSSAGIVLQEVKGKDAVFYKNAFKPCNKVGV